MNEDLEQTTSVTQEQTEAELSKAFQEFFQQQQAAKQTVTQ